MSLLSSIRLSSLSGGQRARVVRILHHDQACAQRLAAFGVTPGTDVTVLQTFPGVVFLCDGTELAVEPDVARSIVVEVL